jgi:alkylation response protein AidB-like acyl-CoA dehydrogenase
MAKSMSSAVLLKSTGGAFLTEDRQPDEIFTPEDLTDEHMAIARTADEFCRNEVEPRIEAMLRKEPGVAITALRKAAELGLTGILIPEKFGGMELDLASLMVAAEHLSADASYSAWHFAHSGIGTLPILYFGTEEQKNKYLPKLASAELLAAYALTEPQAGSDPLAARTQATLSPDGKAYVLNGQKMWITNGAAADLFTVFAKIDGEKFTAFLVERGFGVKSGAEEHKMGIEGSSTTALYFDNVRVPVENVLGEIGRGHIIAFNILNMGRLTLGPAMVGGAKRVLELSIRYARQRKAFGTAIAEFGAIREKLAKMAVRIYAAESMVWRTVGLIQGNLQNFSWEHPDASKTMMKALEEFAVECSAVKVFASEMLDFVVDEGVQIHGGYGYHRDYEVERAYRDSRINRIFEGTNEINRLLIPGMLLKRAARGQGELLHAAAAALTGTVTDGAGSGDEQEMVAQVKRVVLAAAGAAVQKFGPALEREQEILLRLADIMMDLCAMESGLLRARKTPGPEANAHAMCSVYLREALPRIESAAREVFTACGEGEPARKQLGALRQCCERSELNLIEQRRAISSRLLAAGRYVVG